MASTSKKKEVNPTVIVGDSSGLYKPLTKEFGPDKYTHQPCIPKLNWDVVQYPLFSPFLKNEETKILWAKKKDEMKIAASTKEISPAKKGAISGWCECCSAKFTDREEVTKFSVKKTST